VRWCDARVRRMHARTARAVCVGEMASGHVVEEACRGGGSWTCVLIGLATDVVGVFTRNEQQRCSPSCGKDR
jgi:hypothetical protein